MLIMFDLLGTVFGAFDHSLRPGIRETIDSLRESGYQVDFWTSGRVEHYKQLLRQAGIKGEIYKKSAELPRKPDVCIDDEPQDWMPGHLYKVEMHLSQDAPGPEILVAEVLFVNEEANFFWD